MPGMGQGPTTQTQQSSVSNPWGPTQPLLGNILGQLGNTPTQVSPQQQAAQAALSNAAGGLTNFAPQASGGVSGLLSGGGANTYSPMLSGAYHTAQGVLSPYLQSNYLDPNSNPYLKSSLQTMTNDITNQVGGQFAAAGESNSPAYATALSRGLSQGLSPVLMGQYNTNVGTQLGANQSGFGNSMTTAQGLTGFNQLGNQNILSGIGAGSSIPGLAMGPGGAQMSAANLGVQQPFTNMGWLTSLLYPMAALGGQSQGQGTQTQQQNPLSNILGLGMGGLGMLGNMGALGGLGGAAGSAAGGASLAGDLPLVALAL